MRRLCLTAFVICLLFSSTTVIAAMSIPYGWFMEANLGTNKLTDKDYQGSTSASGTGYNINVGYKFMPYLIGELGYTRYARTNVRNNGVLVAIDRRHEYHLAARGIIPLNEKGFEVFAKAGMVRITRNPDILDATLSAALGISGKSTTVNGLLIGAGAQYYFSPDIPVVLQWQRAKGKGNTGTIDFWSLGVAYLFDM